MNLGVKAISTDKMLPLSVCFSSAFAVKKCKFRFMLGEV